MASLPSLPPSATTSILRAALHDRVVGVLVGSALGDAIGLYTEFLTAADAAAAYPTRTFTLTATPHPTPFKLDMHRAPKELGHWTDDTDHALLILLAFLHTARTSPSSPNPSTHPPANATPQANPSPPPPPLPTQHDLALRLHA
ncbi:2a623533-5f1a-4fcc-85de-d0c95e329c29 [Thermothielavioides terrestris]|uniref:ADP-ribosylglycohydrolase-like protein n=2 Tax=Thermothielavioides terrestris TaxID=2587410 RepID=G2R6D6_THETT|nr:uncharacterized protein THITE_2089113 [Thermothielavioides terrestris NRRL 8126]AEO67621.1 hypothetical protein THITE_2089113 [Thermothielavioides terrestris NRRL 8126]SPQ25746.1 2a623533-5f1a-4fcc-85de-d0c95e329c29 [Thermothielavioides terrestris]